MKDSAGANNYIVEIAAHITAQLRWDLKEKDVPLARAYALLCLVRGEAVTSRNVHDAWSAWATGQYPGGHKSLKPFEDLTLEVQALDNIYRDAIVAVAKMRSVGKIGA